MLLMRAGRIAGFDAAKGWPDALTFGELAALQYPEEGSASGCGLGPSYKSLKQTDFWELLNAFEKRGDVQAVKVDRPALGDLSEMWPCDAIDRPAAVAFLNAIHEEPCELVREWLGMYWQLAHVPKNAGSEKPEPPAVTLDKVNKWDVAGSWEQQARAIGQGWMLEQRKLLKEADWPGVEAIAKHVEGELSTREITGKRGKYLDWETIKREALTGITGRKAKGKK
jgi:hypothetical protein